MYNHIAYNAIRFISVLQKSSRVHFTESPYLITATLITAYLITAILMK